MSITKYASEKWVKDQVSWSNLEDKPFGDIVASIGDTLTWDGDVTGKYCVEVEPELKCCLVSRNIPTKEDFLNGCTLVANMSGTTQVIEVTPDMVSENITFMEDGYIIAGSVTVIPYDNYTVNEEFLFEKSGVYFSRGDYGDASNYPQSLTIPGFEFGSTTIKKIDPKFLPEGIEHIELTQAEYNELEKSGQIKSNITYFITDGEGGEGGVSGNANIVKLTQAEYDALPESKNSDGILYAITDGESSSGSTSKPVELTKAQYEALGDSVLTDGILYAITDGDGLTAKNLEYDGSVTELGNNVQEAIDKLNAYLIGQKATINVYEERIATLEAYLEDSLYEQITLSGSGYKYFDGASSGKQYHWIEFSRPFAEVPTIVTKETTGSNTKWVGYSDVTCAGFYLWVSSYSTYQDVYFSWTATGKARVQS